MRASYGVALEPAFLRDWQGKYGREAAGLRGNKRGPANVGKRSSSHHMDLMTLLFTFSHERESCQMLLSANGRYLTRSTVGVDRRCNVSISGKAKCRLRRLERLGCVRWEGLDKVRNELHSEC